jgi:general secretion pathway protein D
MSLQRQKKRASGLWAAAALSTAMLAGAGVHARASDDAFPRDQEVTRATNLMVDRLELAEAPLTVAVKLLQQKTGLDIVFVGNVKNLNPVTVSLRKKPVEEALDLIALSAGADVWRENGVFYIGPKGSAPKRIEEPTPAPVETRPNVPLRWEKIKLLQTEPQELLQRMFHISTGPLADLNTKFIQSLIGDLTNPNKNPYDGLNRMNANFQPVQMAAPTTASPQPFAAPSVPTGSPGYTTNNSNLENLNGAQGNTNLGAAPNDGSGSSDQSAHRDNGDSRQEFGRGGQRGGGFGGGGIGGGFQGGGIGGGFGGQPGGFGGGGIGGQGGFGGQGGQAQQGVARALLPEGIQNIFGYEPDNSIIVQGTPDAIRDLREIIRFFDVAPRQLQVKAEFLTVSQNDTNSFGINWSFQKVNLQAGVNTGFTSNNTAFITYAAGNLQAQLSWILTTGRGKIVAAPTATTFNNVPVPLSVGETVPVFISQPVVTQNGTVVLATQIIAVPIFTQMLILPRINADNTITVFGQVSIQGTRTFVTGPQGETAPVVTAQQVRVQRRIRNGETMVIGGLVQKNDNVTQAKVPLLGDLPLIGNLFKSRNVTTADSELLVFITPSIIPEHNEAGALRGGGGAAPLVAPPGGAAGPGGAGGGLMP